MQRLLLAFFLVWLVNFSQAQTGNYKWSEVLPPGNGRWTESWIPGKWPMGINPLIAFSNQLFIIGAKTTWISRDGINWIARPKTDWGERHGMTYVFFDGKIWMMGGMKTWDKFYNDVWCSKDGLEWKQVKQQATWPERRGHSVVVYKNRLWLFGGSISTGVANTPPTHRLNDVWSSPDGENWTNESPGANWNAGDPQVVVFNDRLHLFNTDGSTLWTSTDGIEWSISTNKTSWDARLNFGLLVYDNKLWLFGGREHNDVWYSTDGKNWMQETSSAPWSKRTAYHSIVYLNKLWIYSGKTGREDSWSGDVWTMTKEKIIYH